jgi:hypothetical protein
MISKRWIRVWLSTIMLIPIVGFVNYIVDPNWTFNHSNIFNSKQKGFNERQQKTNYIYFNWQDNLQGVLLGSSRSTYMDQNEFHNMNIYNYSVNSMLPDEYNEYINFVKKINGKELKYIVLGIDFFGTNAIKGTLEFQSPEFYIINTTSGLYRYRMLFSLDTLRFSFKNIKNMYRNSQHYYTRDNVHYRGKVDEAERLKNYKVNLKKHTNTFIGENYLYDMRYKGVLNKLKAENPNTKFIVFTTPISADLLVSVIKNGKRINEFERWLNETIDVFGEVHHFMTINSVTRDLQNYPDDDHFYPQIATLLANKISGKENKKIPKDFGMILNKDTVSRYLIQFKRQIADYELNTSIVL